MYVHEDIGAEGTNLIELLKMLLLRKGLKARVQIFREVRDQRGHSLDSYGARGLVPFLM